MNKVLKETKQFSCYCNGCKNARKRLKNLSKEESSAISYHLQKILQDDLEAGNY